jgi:hypothetical protein
MGALDSKSFNYFGLWLALTEYPIVRWRHFIVKAERQPVIMRDIPPDLFPRAAVRHVDTGSDWGCPALTVQSDDNK